MRSILWLALSCFLVASAADAAPRKSKRPVRKGPVKAASRMPAKPPAPKLPTTAGIMVPKSVVLIRAIPAETRAHAVWTLRAALNVAALQCQYSPFLRSVDNYNQMLKKHGGELTSAQMTMLSHYTRTMKRGGAAAFDRYNTRSYNSFSTLDAQYNFCWAAGQAGQAVRVGDVGAMGRIAEAMVPELRAALAYVPPAAGLNVPPLPPLPDVRPDLANLTEN
ncbi:hypothetical protein [Sandarakinorhabdus limnophila]|jgi:hypothetical protein|uniref:hypothetical protein n=2 Tax=Sandarakinorhabdus limnophila TaxID=210512 RepID=UPI0003B4A88F|nr:hypothetical protein [Sandarakinorhabdus limnophila]